MQIGKGAVISGVRGPIEIEIAREYAASRPTAMVCSREMASAENPAILINGNVYPERRDVTVVL